MTRIDKPRTVSLKAVEDASLFRHPACGQALLLLLLSALCTPSSAQDSEDELGSWFM